MKKNLLLTVLCCFIATIVLGQPPCTYDNSTIDGTVTMPTNNTPGTDGGIFPGDMLQFNGLIVGKQYRITTCPESITGSAPGGNFDIQMTVWEDNNIGTTVITSNDNMTPACTSSAGAAEVVFTYTGTSGNIDVLFTNNDSGVGGTGHCSYNCGGPAGICTIAAIVGFECIDCPVNSPMPPPCPYDNPTEADPGENTVNLPSGPAPGTECCISPGEFILFCNFIDGETYTLTSCAATVPGATPGGFDPDFTLYTPGGGMVIASNGDTPGCSNAAEITFTWDSALYGGNCAELLVDNAEAINGGPCSNNWIGTIRAEIGYVCTTCPAPPAGPPCPYDNTPIGVQAMPFTNAPGEECCIHPGEMLEFCGLQTGQEYTITTCAATFPPPIAANDGAFDPQITVFESGGVAVITSSDNLAGCGNSAEVTFTWTGVNGGCADVLMDNGEAAFGGPCSHNWSGTIRATLGFACNTCPPPAPGTENEDCNIAELVCTSGPITFNSSGPGIDDFAPAANQFGCLDATAPEHQSAWYYFAFSDDMPANSSIEFTLDPGAGSGADFDFAVWGPDVSCDALGAPIRCSGASPDCTECPQTGVGNGQVDVAEIGGCGDPIDCIGCSGPCDGFVAPILVQPGEGYYLMIDNWLGDSQGFTLTWGGTAAPFLDCSTQVPCGVTSEAGMDESLCGGAVSSLNGSAAGATGSESYTWQGDQPSSTGFLSNPSMPNPTLTIPDDFSGIITYTLTVTEGSCTNFDEVVITVDPAGDAGEDSSASACPGGSSIDLFDSLGGTPDNTGSWSPSLGNGHQGTFDPNSDNPGTYTYTVSPGGNCPDVTAEITVDVSGPTATISGDNSICSGNSTTLSASGGTSFQWDDSSSSTTPSITVNDAGTYNVTVSDAGGCTDTESITVTQNTGPSPSISGTTSYCTGNSTTLDAGTGFSSYQWGGESSATTQTVDAMTPGDYIVTVTDGNGCTGETMVTVTEEAELMPTISGDADYCPGNSTMLDAGSGFSSYQWGGQSSETTQTIDASLPGDYFVTVTDGNGCTGETMVTVAENTPPSPSIAGNTSYCPGNSTMLDVGSGFSSYQWGGQSSETTQTIDATTPGDYFVTVTDGNGCTGETMVTVTEEAELMPTISGTTNFCPGNSTMLDAGSYTSYLWGGESSATTQTIDATTAGDYFVTVTDANGCTGSATVSVSENAEPMPTIGGSTSFCPSSSTTLDAGSYASYQWGGGSNATTQTITANSADDYFVTVTDANGCTGTAMVTISEEASLNPVITGADNFCPGASTMLDAGSGFDTYQWGGQSSETTQSIDASMPGDYFVTVTDASGCSGETMITVAENTSPNPSISGAISYCSGGSTMLDAGSYSSYQWGGQSSETTQMIDATMPGDYSVTVTDTNGCTGETMVTVTEAAELMPIISGTTNFCPGGSTMLDAGAFSSYQWGGQSSETTQVIDATTPGDYFVTVTDTSGCTGETMITVAENTPPNPTIGGSTSFCPGSSTTIDAGAYQSYQWGGQSTETTQSITTNTAGDYFVTVTDANGCTGETMVSVTESASLNPTISGANSFCQGASTMLDAGSGFDTYQWGGQSSETTQTIDATMPGDYFVTVTDVSGCSGETMITVAENMPPNPTISGANSFCSGNSTMLDAGSFTSYQWGGQSSATTQMIDATMPGDYFVTVTDANGCTGETMISVAENAEPTPLINGSTSFCSGSSTMLDAGSFNSYQWGGQSSATTQMIDATLPGDYSVTVTDVNGCTGETMVSVTESASLNPTISGANSFCQGTSTMLDAGSGFSSYQWGGQSSETTQTIDATMPGDYSVTVTDASGCTGETMISVAENAEPTPTISGNNSFCEGSSTMLDAGNFASYQWGGQSNATTQTIDATAAGDYFVTVTDNNGCTGTATLSVAETPPYTIAITGEDSFCNDGTDAADLDAGSFQNYTWSNGATTQTIAANMGGVFSVTVTDADGCTGQGSFTVAQNNLPTASISGSTTYCTGGETQLTASGGNTYSWSTGASGNMVTISNPGSVSVTVTDANGCEASNTIEVIENSSLNPTISGANALCEGNTVTLDAGAGFTTYTWSNGASTNSIDITDGGIYDVVVEDANGCTGSASINITENTPPDPTISGDETLCSGGGDPADLDAGGGFASYLWSGGETTQNISTTNPGNYSVVVTDANGCTGEADFTVAENPAPTPSISGDDTVCSGETTNLDAGGFTSYSWSTGAISQSINNVGVGNYGVTVTDANGCTGETSFTVAEEAPIAVSISGDNSFCSGSGQMADLDAGPGFTTYDWSNGSNAQNISTTNGGTFTVTVTDTNGCTGEDSFTVAANDPPAANITGSQTFCSGSNTTLSAPTGAGLTYQWSDGSTGSSITVDQANTYSVIITNAEGCSSEASINVQESASLNPSISGNNTFCEGNSTTLDAGSFANYTWSNGANTQTISPTMAGNYAVTVSDASGCTGVDNIQITPAPSPNPNINGDDTFCEGNATTLTASGAGPGGFYQWSNGATGSTISAGNSGTFTVIVTNSAGCTAETGIAVAENPVPTTFIAGDTEICPGEITSLNAGAGFVSYFWSNGTTGQNNTIGNPGFVSVTVTDINGCQGEANTVITEAQSPVVNISGDDSVCEGETVTLDAGNPGNSYQWSNGSTSQSINVTNSGTYGVVVTNATGCSAMDELTVSVAPNPTAIIGGSTSFCSGSSTTLDAGPGFSYLWSNGATSQSIVVNNPGSVSVLIMNATGCSDEATVNVTESASLQPNITGDAVFCEGGQTTLNAGSGFATYQWSNGSSSQQIPVQNSGNFSVTVTDGTGCSGSANLIVTEALNPVANISGDLDFCPGQATVLNAGNGFANYSWSTGNLNQIVTIANEGSISVTVTDENGCSDIATVQVTENEAPVAAIQGDTEFCENENTVLDAGTGFASYLWSDNTTNQTTNVNATGTYIVTVTDDNGCTGTANVSVIENDNPTPAISGDESFCEGDEANLNVGNNFVSYTWSNGGTTPQITVQDGGTYGVVVQDQNGCFGMAEYTVVENDNPEITIGGSTTFCNGSQTTLNAGSGFANYEWSNGSTSPSIVVNTEGDFDVVVTDNNGCVGTAATTVTESAELEPVIAGATNFCEGGETTLNAGSGFANYEWSNGETSQIITVTNPDDYAVTVSDNSGGCTGEATVSVVENANPEAAISGGTEICPDEETTLDAGAGFEYEWSTGNLNQTINTTNGGTFTVTITDDNGCQDIATIEVTQFDAPEPVITGNDAICPGETTTLDAGIFASYEWSNGSVNATLPVMNGGTFSVIVTDDNDCVGEANFTVVQNVAPEVSILGENSFCDGETVQLDAGFGFATYQWSDGTTNQTLDASDSGTFGVVVTNAEGCEGEAEFTTVENDNPEVSIGGSSTFCVGSSTTLDVGNNFASVLWSDGSTTPSISVNANGDITVIVTDANGCEANSSITVSESDQLTVNLIGQPDFCEGASIVLDAGSGFANYEWSNGNMTQSVILDTPNTYTVTVDDGTGCTGEASIEVIENANPVPTITGTLEFCTGTSTTLTAEAGFESYLWSNNSINQTLDVSNAGNIVLTVEDANGCVGSSDVDVIESEEIAIEILGPTTFCPGSSATLDAGPGATYEWSNGETTQTIEVNTQGTFTVIVTNTEGCSGSDVITVTETEELEFEILGPTTICDNGTITLDAGAGFDTYLWSNGETTQTIEVIQAGDFNVMVTDASGCEGSAALTVAEAAPIELTIEGSDTVCEGQTTILDAGSGFATYQWSNGANTQTIEVGGGDFEVIVTSAEGCEGSDMLTVQEAEELEVEILGAEDFCNGETVTLDAGDGFDTYAWSNGATSQTIIVDATGTYNVEVADALGCVGTASASVQEFEEITVSISGSATFCTGNFTTLDAGSGFDTYQWSTGETTQTIQVANPGEITLQVTNTDGCLAENSLMVTESTELEPQIAGALDFCAGDETTLDAGSGFTTYEWSNGETTQTITTNAPGDYTVMVADATGCTGEGTVSVFENQLPIVEISTANPNFCEDASATLDAGSGFANYQWSNSELNQTTEINTSGAFSVVVTDNNGCTNSDEIIMNAVPLPSANAGNDAELDCIITEAELTGSGTGNSLTYQWSTNDGNIEGDPNQQNVMINAGGIYTLTVIENLAGCVSTDELVVIQDVELPDVNAGLDLELDCMSNETELDGTGSAQGSEFTYEWTAQNGSPIENANSLIPTITQPDVYTLIVTNTLTNCSDSDIITVMADMDAPQDIELAVDSPTCAGDNDGSIAIEKVNGGIGPFNYSINGQAFSSNAVFPTLLAGDYTIEVQGSNGCVLAQTVSLEDGNILEVEAGEDQMIQLGQNADLSAIINLPLNQIETVQWSAVDTSMCEICPDIKVSPVNSTLYTITVIDKNGCEVTDFLNVLVNSEVEVHFPSAFSPNRDGRNEVFYPFAEEGFVQNINTFQVFNRWGAQVYGISDILPNDPTAGWNGTFKGEIAEMGVYVFFAEVELINGEKVTFKGGVNLLR